jgi:hypothetical protein
LLYLPYIHLSIYIKKHEKNNRIQFTYNFKHKLHQSKNQSQ